MRTLWVGLVGLGLLGLVLPATASAQSGPVSAAPAVRFSMPVELLAFAPGETQAGDVWFSTAGHTDAPHDLPEAPYDMTIYFAHDGTRLGDFLFGTWQIRPVTYCRDRDGWVQSVLTAPSGQQWLGERIEVAAGPDGYRTWSSGQTDGLGPLNPSAGPGLREALTAGGVFRLALRDDEGVEWDAITIDTLTPGGRGEVYAANLARARRLLPPENAPPVLLPRIEPDPGVNAHMRPRPCPRLA